MIDDTHGALRQGEAERRRGEADGSRADSEMPAVREEEPREGGEHAERSLRPGVVLGLLLILAAALIWRDAMSPPTPPEIRAPALEERPVDAPSDTFDDLLVA